MYGKLDSEGRLIRFGSKVKINGSWVDISSASAWRAANGVKVLVDDGGVECPCGDGEIPVPNGWQDNGEGGLVRQYVATAVDDADIKSIAKSITDTDAAAMDGDEKDELLHRLAKYVASCASCFAAIAAFGSVTTTRLGSLTSANNVVTAVTEEDPNVSNIVTKAYVESLGIGGFSWLRPNDWCVDVDVIKSVQTDGNGTSEVYTDDYGRVLSNYVYTATYQMAAQCSARLLDETSTQTPQISLWSATSPLASITTSGYFTAQESGLYRVSATDANGVVRYADVAVSDARTVVETNETYYVADKAGSTRLAVNDAALAVLNAAEVVGTGTYGSETYSVYGTFVPRFCPTMVAAGNYTPFAVSPHCLISAAHYSDGIRRYGERTFTDGVNSATVVMQVWTNLRDWALAHGFTEAEAAKADDIAMVTCTGEAIPDGCLPRFMSSVKREQLFAGALGIQGWFASQRHAYAQPLTFGNEFRIWNTGSAWARADVAARLGEMGRQCPVYSGDSGKPIFLMLNGEPVVVGHFTGVGSCRADYSAALPIIKAFVAQQGDTIKEVE